MNPSSGSRPAGAGENACRRAFTLIELTLVMAILVIVVGVSLPRLKNFFRGRNIESESRRLLELTRYAQSRAVSEGVPMVVWIDARRGAYGMNEEAGYTEGDPKAVTFRLDPDLTISVVQGRTKSAVKAGLPSIYFLPEDVVGPSSVNAVCLQDGSPQPVWLVESADGARYEIRHQYNIRTPGR
jgi:prepilin-type N-terminal cleavage/methylation domain-containing protein